MSHFTVLVVGQDPEKQLAPFQENNMGDCPEEYMSFRDDTEDLTKEYEEEGREFVLLASGERLSKYDDRFKVEKKDFFAQTEYKYPDDSTIMGWWGIVIDEKNPDDWHAEFAKLLDGLPDDTLLSVYDCHI